MKPVLPQVL